MIVLDSDQFSRADLRAPVATPPFPERPPREERHRGHGVPVAGDVEGIGFSLFPARNSAYQLAVMEVVQVVQAPPHDQVSQADQRDAHPVAAEVEEGEGDGEGEVCLPS